MALTAYTNCSPIVLGCFLYTDSGLTTPVANGFYSNGVNVFEVTGGLGEITNVTSCPVTTTTTTTSTTTAAPTTTTTTTSTTTAAPTTTTTTTTTTLAFETFDLGYAITNGNDACTDAIVSPSFYYASSGSTFTAGTILYTDTTLTTLAPDDYYSDGITWFLITGGNGTLTGGTLCNPITTSTTTTTTTVASTTTTTTTTTIAVTCNTYQINPDIGGVSVEWFDCGGSYLTATYFSQTSVCAQTGTLIITGGGATINDLGSC